MLELTHKEMEKLYTANKVGIKPEFRYAVFEMESGEVIESKPFFTGRFNCWIRRPETQTETR